MENKKKTNLLNIILIIFIIALLISAICYFIYIQVKKNDSTNTANTETTNTENAELTNTENNETEVAETTKSKNLTFTKEEYPKVDGATAMLPMSIEIAKSVIGLSDSEAESFIFHNTTSKAYENLINKKLI